MSPFGLLKIGQACLFFILLGVAIFSNACSHKPGDFPVAYTPRQKETLTDLCEGVFPERAYRVTHRIQASLPAGGQTDLIGITLFDPKRRIMRSVLMSVEGVRLFDATSSTDGLKIHKSVPPFDKKSFAKALFMDIKLLFFKPQTKPTSFGGRVDESWTLFNTCRYKRGERVDEIGFNVKFGAKRLVMEGHRVTKEIIFHDLSYRSVARHARIVTPGGLGYSLDLSLLDAEPIDFSESLFSP